MFRGINSITIDPKGRVAIPARYREQIRQGRTYDLVATIDTESPCLLLYPTSEWELIEAKLQQLSSFNPATRRIQRLLLGHATELEMDNTGRVLLPPLLRDYASLDKKVILLGQGRKFELWDETVWEEQRERWLLEERNKMGEVPEELQHIAL
ncbi:MAG: division/cell wall cluster transcriptional repressor MraZ [Gammaproteobacteria bacterium]